MAVVRKEGDKLIIEIPVEEATDIQPGDTVKIIKIDSPTVSQQVKDATEEALRVFAEDLEYLRNN
jgi:protein involved in polysaccharide export with SLBB domain